MHHTGTIVHYWQGGSRFNRTSASLRVQKTLELESWKFEKRNASRLTKYGPCTKKVDINCPGHYLNTKNEFHLCAFQTSLLAPQKRKEARAGHYMAICSAALICSSDHNVLRLLGDGFFINLEHTSFAESIEGSLTQVHSQLQSITIDIIRWQITGRGRLTNKAKLQKVFLGVHWTKGPVKRAPSWCQLFAQLSPLWSPPPPPALTCSAQSTSTASSVTLIHILARFWEPSEPMASNW